MTDRNLSVFYLKGNINLNGVICVNTSRLYKGCVCQNYVVNIL